MIKLDRLTPNFKQNILISVNALIDIDVGLFRVIHDEYLDPSAFDTDYFNKSNVLDYIKTTYYRTQDNPLYSIASKNCDHNILDEYYMEFYKTEFNKIYDKSVYTDVLELVNLFCSNSNGELSVFIMYYQDYSLEKLKIDQDNGTIPKEVEFISGKEMKPKTLNEFDQIYLRSVTEFNILPIKSLQSPKTFYISSFGPNYGESGRIKRSKGLNDIMTSKLMHEIATFDMYNNKNIQYTKNEDKGV